MKESHLNPILFTHGISLLEKSPPLKNQNPISYVYFAFEIFRSDWKNCDWIWVKGELKDYIWEDFDKLGLDNLGQIRAKNLVLIWIIEFACLFTPVKRT